MPAPEERLDLMRQGEVFFLAALDRVDDEALTQPSALPDWSRAHVVAHMARNADALGNLVSWARTGVESPMYASPDARAEGIEVGIAQAPAALRADLRDASQRLLDAFATMPVESWDAEVRTRAGRVIPASEVPWMRIRESWVHTVDLDAGASFGELPTVVVTDLLDEVASGLAGREDCPAMTIVAGERSWDVGATGDRVTVAAAAPDVLAWLLGRAPLADAPDPPAWL